MIKVGKKGMLKMNYYYTIQTLLGRGKNISQIARELGIDRKTVRKIKNRFVDGTIVDKNGNILIPKVNRKSKLDPYKEDIKEFLERGYTITIMQRKLNELTGKEFNYNTIKYFVSKIKPLETYIPIITPAGQEAQVDFGYAGIFEWKGKKRKVWVFCMLLCHSRYAYYELVLDQSTQTFINCHINAFEYFGGVPEVVRIDNLKAAVLKANFYEATFQIEYSNFLRHYGSSPITCRVRRGQDKGKVESGIKYVKYNFLKGLTVNELSSAKKELQNWMINICNNRIHGTTKKIPSNEFYTKEKDILLSLPEERFQTFVMGKRIVNAYSHISFMSNYYSVPYKYRNEQVHIKSNGKILIIYNSDYKEIAVHQISNDPGNFISKEEHINPHKQRQSEEEYDKKVLQIGMPAFEYYAKLKELYPHHWHRMTRGILSLAKIYTTEILNKSCQRALEYDLFGYKEIKRICENKLYDCQAETHSSVCSSGYCHNLNVYDNLSFGGNNE